VLKKIKPHRDERDERTLIPLIFKKIKPQRNESDERL